MRTASFNRRLLWRRCVCGGDAGRERECTQVEATLCCRGSALGNRFNFPLLCAALVKIAAVAVLVCRGRALCAERIAPLPTLCGLCSTTIVLADLPWCSER